jgi:hypothetical protein
MSNAVRLGVFLVCALGALAHAAEIKVLSMIGVRSMVGELALQFEQQTDHKLAFTCVPLAGWQVETCIGPQVYSLAKEIRQPLPAAEGTPERYASEYERYGTATICMCSEPLRGVREEWQAAAQYLARRRAVEAELPHASTV